EKVKSIKSPTTQQPRVDQSDALVPLSLYDPLNPPTLIERVRARLPKRILSIDDGAAGGFIAFEFLAEIERRLQVRYGEAKFVLSDYFDLIGGVGTGTLIATDLTLYGCLSMPTYFPPFEVSLSSGEKALFQDGILCVGSNPTLYLFSLATNPTFSFQ